MYCLVRSLQAILLGRDLALALSRSVALRDRTSEQQNNPNLALSRVCRLYARVKLLEKAPEK